VDGASSLARIREYVDRHRERLATPGLAIAATDRDGCLGLVLDGVADVPARTPVAEHHRFQIGSISKGFTALAVLQQVEEGRVDLDAPVTEYLPWFRVRSAFGAITIHHLLSHTGGLVTGTDVTGEAVSDVWELRETVAGFAPGRRFHYSNAGYKALGLVIEAVTGAPWWFAVRERVMRPIGMGEAEVVITNATRDRLAAGHTSPHDDRPWLPRHGWVPSPWFESTTADGTICATAEELTAYARLWLRDGDGVVSPASFERLTAPVAADPEEPGEVYGYGIRWIEGAGPRRLLGHTGSMVGFTAHLLVDVEAGVGVVILMNSAFGRRNELARFAAACLAAEAAGGPLPDVPDPANPAAIETRDEMAGRYVDAAGAVDIVPDGSGLRLVADGETGPLVAMDTDGTFAVDHPALERFPVRFAHEQGRVAGAMWGPRWLWREGVPWADDPEPPSEWAAYPGRYASWNPWAPGFRVFLRRGVLELAVTGDPLGWEPERQLVPAEDGSFRVGGPGSPDRVRFDAEIDGWTHRAVLDGAPYYRRREV
jgi:D-alanyl-D-alanine carboxypeptidase